ELDRLRELRACGAVLREFPDERVLLDRDRAEPRVTPADVVDDPVPRQRRRARGQVEERQPQWKYWPPSITIVCPVTKSEPGPQRLAMIGITARQVRNIEATLTSMTRRHSSSGISVNGRIDSVA